MCGICLIYQQPGNHRGLDVIDAMVDSLQHRGPDQQSQLVLSHIALGHTRLSIVDVKGGNQPMSGADRDYHIIYNGELYNYKELRRDLEKQGYRFHSDSDTEVVLAMYIKHGADCLQKFQGMFAFAVYHQSHQTVFIARDRMGIKPLFYHWDGENLIAASEVKALFASGRVKARFNLHSIQNYLFYQFNICPNTLFDSVYELPPAHFMLLEPGRAPALRAYWDLELPRDGEYESDDEEYWLDEFESALNNAAQSHAIGELPIGAYLSGGIDSASTTCLLKEANHAELDSFTIQFANPDFDESGIAAEIAEHLGVANHVLHMPHGDETDYLNQFCEALYHLEQVQRMAVDIPHFMLSQFVSDKKYKVVYTGDGADEILAGYDCFRQNYIRLWGNNYQNGDERWDYYLREFSSFLSEDYLRLLFDLHQEKAQQETRNQFGFYPAWYDFWQILSQYQEGLFSDEFVAANQDNQQMQQLIAAVKPKVEGLHLLNKSLYLEYKTRLPGWILWKSDRLSMAHGLEIRVPFMDNRVVDVASRLPPDLKLNGMEEKYILKQLMWPQLPSHPQSYKKRAFYSPIREWLFTAKNRSRLESFLSRDSLQEAGVFNIDRVEELWRQIYNADTPQSMNQFYQMMRLEWVLMIVLSVQILHSLFIAKKERLFPKI